MRNERMNFSVQEYNKLKFDFFSLLENGKKRKGDVRAFVGLKTWFYEKERLLAGEDKLSAHFAAFEQAIIDTSNLVTQEKFHQQLKANLQKWKSEKHELVRESGGKVLAPPPIPDMKKWKSNNLTLISLFSGALGLDLGFLAAGFDLRITNDIDKNSKMTVNENLPSVPFIHEDFSKLKIKDVLEIAGLDVGEVDVLTGGPPCQPFSTAGKRQCLNDPRASPLKEFARAIKEIKPRAFVMEEVKGLLSARLVHVPISQRKGRTLRPEEKKGSAFDVILEMLESTGYKIIYNELNAADFGSPQCRKRLVFIGLRDGIPSLPKKTHSKTIELDADGKKLKAWNSFWDATIDIQGKDQEKSTFSEKTKKYLRYVPPGGYWQHIPEDLQKEAMGGAFFSGGGKMGYYRRLSWDWPSPTVVTSPTQKGTMFIHPEECRPLSVQEYKRIQGFPNDWKIVAPTANKYKLIGNAVPVHLSYAIAKKVISLLNN